MTQIRNQLAFHYKDEGELIGANFESLASTEFWDFYLSESVSNSFYYAAELVVSASLIALAGGAQANEEVGSELSDQERGFKRLCDLTIAVSDRMTTLFGECIASIVEDNFGHDVHFESIELGDLPRLTSVRVPFFMDDSEFQRKARK
jgi:hypothetical protein